MKKREAEGALACAGAIIGAGFVSGREVVTFFSQYGNHSWWLILLAVTVMLSLCALCLRRSSGRSCDSWCQAVSVAGPGKAAAEGCMAVLLCVIGGAMVSAAGHMGMLALPSPWAYSGTAVGTLCLAWLLCLAGIKPLSWLSGVLALVFVAAVFLLLRTEPLRPVVYTASPATAAGLALAAVRAVAYASMNLAVAIGVVCRAGCACKRSNDRQATGFALLMALLLFVGNYLYLKHPELRDAAFPMVALFSRLGRLGFWLSVTLLYLAILTTLVAVVCALRGIAEPRIRSRPLSAAAVLGAPLCVSMVGFTGIVDGLYTPAGLVCLALVFLPMARSQPAERRRKGGPIGASARTKPGAHP